ncbi:hypothetical protein BGI41_02915 [Methanobrevibacter sp. 87.7]|uniref:PH domain-containing protein n=1 Tax=Methanobrevibacter sp. 87.7 TaxID=387957 RepID=UPI000B4FFB9D|nr:PH domain-containing protein [Methanobrevibacter sp. 87.7]OWT33337.1 hypothetical protein BGI41_02915 [Methanobrevibacter sp. 87.7]
MIFDDDENLANEEVLYEGKPSFIFSCKSIILGILAISFILGSSLTVLSSVSEIQSYSLDFIQQPIGQFIALAIYGIVFLILIWIIVKLLKWYSVNYIITNKRIISKSGIIRQNKSYMSFHNIQDINVSQSLIQRLLGVGTIEIMSAYDNSDVSLKYIHYPKDVEEIIFNGMNNSPSFGLQGSRFGPEENYPNDSRYNSNYGPDYNENYRYGESYNPNYNRATLYNESRPIKDSYIKENYPDYEEDNSFYGLSDEPLNSPKDNEIYYNDYQDPNEFDETINQAVRNFDGNIKFKDDNLVNNHRNKSGINYQGRRINKHNFDNSRNEYSNEEYYPNEYSRYSNDDYSQRYDDYRHHLKINDNNSYYPPRNYNNHENPRYENISRGYSREDDFNDYEDISRGYSREKEFNPRYSRNENHNEYVNPRYDNSKNTSKVRYHGYDKQSKSNPRYHGYDEDNSFYQEKRRNDEYNHHSNKNRKYNEDKEIDEEHHEELKSKNPKTRDSVLAKHDRKFKF